MITTYNKTLDSLLDCWAVWVHQGGVSGGFQSVLHKMMVTGCMTSTGGGKSPEVFTIEADIEACLAALTMTKPQELNLMRVNCLRYEFNARSLGWQPDASRAEKAQRIGISLRTYKRHLKYCKDHIVSTLELRAI